MIYAKKLKIVKYNNCKVYRLFRNKQKQQMIQKRTSVAQRSSVCSSASTSNHNSRIIQAVYPKPTKVTAKIGTVNLKQAMLSLKAKSRGQSTKVPSFTMTNFYATGSYPHKLVANRFKKSVVHPVSLILITVSNFLMLFLFFRCMNKYLSLSQRETSRFRNLLCLLKCTADTRKVNH